MSGAAAWLKKTERDVLAVASSVFCVCRFWCYRVRFRSRAQGPGTWDELRTGNPAVLQLPGVCICASGVAMSGEVWLLMSQARYFFLLIEGQCEGQRTKAALLYLRTANASVISCRAMPWS